MGGKASAAKRKRRKMLRSLQSKQTKEGGVSLTPGSVDRRLRTHMCVYVHAIVELIRQRFPGTPEDVGEGPCGS